MWAGSPDSRPQRVAKAGRVKPGVRASEELMGFSVAAGDLAPWADRHSAHCAISVISWALTGLIGLRGDLLLAAHGRFEHPQ